MGSTKPQILVAGYGRMGKLVHKVGKERGESIVGIAEPDKEKVPADFKEELWIPGVERLADGDSEVTEPDNPGIVYGTDTAICFTTVGAAHETTKFLLGRGIDTIVGTTKWYLNPDESINEEMIAELDEIAKANECRFVYASNFSIGVHVFWQELKQLAPKLASQGYDAAVVEEHHTRKKDAPSGTANTIGRILLEAYGGKKTVLKKDFSTPIQPHEIGISAVRAGDIPGTHKVIFESPVDRFVLEHIVKDRAIFARGAIDTAYWAKEQAPGAYSIEKRLE